MKTKKVFEIIVWIIAISAIVLTVAAILYKTLQ